MGIKHRILDSKVIMRFMEKVSLTTDPDACWEWTGAKFKPGGYGSFSLGGKSCSAHEISHRIFIGPIPDGHETRHKRPCKCVNPRHLTTGTTFQNIQDALYQGTFYSVLSPDQVRYIRASPKSLRDLALELDVHINTVYFARTHKTHAWVK